MFYKIIANEIRSRIGNNVIEISADETTDKCCPYTVQCIRETIKPSHPHVIVTRELQKFVNSTNTRFIINSF